MKSTFIERNKKFSYRGQATVSGENVKIFDVYELEDNSWIYQQTLYVDTKATIKEIISESEIY